MNNNFKNLPNYLTLSRILMIPVFLILFYASVKYEMIELRYLSGAVFTIASITDYFDGKIARKYNLVSNFGKLMDPLADKLLVISVVMSLNYFTNEINFICVFLIVMRELIISAIRLVALEENIVIAASKLGKYKTATQMVSLVLILLNIHRISKITYCFTYGLFYFSMFFLVISLIDYIIKSKDCFRFL